MDIAFSVQLPDWERALARKPMPAMDGDHHLLRKQRHDMRAVTAILARQCVDRDFEIAGEQALP